MTYIVNMASGQPYPDDELVHQHKWVAQQPHPAPIPGTECTQLQLQLVTTRQTHTHLNAAAGLHISALMQSLED